MKLINKIILISFVLLILPYSATALSFSPFNGGTAAGRINTGNNYFDDDAFFYGYSGSRNVYIVSENNETWLFEPISGTSFKVINSTTNTLNDAVVHKGFVYFIDGTTLKKKTTRNVNNFCEATDTSAGGCIRIISTSVGPTIRVYNNVLYYVKGNSMKHLDIDDNEVTDFNLGILTGGQSHIQSFAVTSVSGVLTVFTTTKAGTDTVSSAWCISSGCTALTSLANGNPASFWTLYVTTSFAYAYGQTSGGGAVIETSYFISNKTVHSVDYISTVYNSNDRAYVGSLSTVGLLNNPTTYETFNSNEVGAGASSPVSQGSGVVTYVNKEISVPNPTYYNDSVIPIDIALKFIISNANKTNYTNSLFWHVKINDPLGIQVFDLNLPGIACVQQTPWWDVGGIFSALGLLGQSPWACDGSGEIQYTRSPGQFWHNGTFTVFLTEQLPGQTFILSSDTWNIVNQTSNNPGSAVEPPSCPTCGISGPGTVTINTALSIIAVLGFVAFWGFVLWLGIVFTAFRTMSQQGGSVNGVALIAVSWLSSVLIALVGLFDPFKIYVIVLSTIIAAILFRLGASATTGTD